MYALYPVASRCTRGQTYEPGQRLRLTSAGSGAMMRQKPSWRPEDIVVPDIRQNKMTVAGRV